MSRPSLTPSIKKFGRGVPKGYSVEAKGFSEFKEISEYKEFSEYSAF